MLINREYRTNRMLVRLFEGWQRVGFDTTDEEKYDTTQKLQQYKGRCEELRKLKEFRRKEV